jgi:uncharacterized protein
MDSPGRGSVAPVVVDDDDPWATLAAPDVPSLPVPGDAVRPTMPWDDTDDRPAGDAGTAAGPAPEPGPVAFVRPPGTIPTAVDASLTRTSFPPGVAAKLAAYVYLLVDARTGRPFFVGRGRGDRCFRHVEAARTPPPSDVRASKPPKAHRFAAVERIREAESDGRPVRIDILRHGLSREQADLVVASVDDALDLGLAPGPGPQRAPAVELGDALARRARIKHSHPLVLLRVGGHGADAGYESARHGWRIGRRWVDLDSPRSPRWAVLVAGELVEAVYRIEGWEESPPSGPPASRAAERFSFTGGRDAELESRYVGRSVAAYLGTGPPGPVTYVWCGPHGVDTAR